jgi:hypothetical protein
LLYFVISAPLHFLAFDKDPCACAVDTKIESATDFSSLDFATTDLLSSLAFSLALFLSSLAFAARAFFSSLAAASVLGDF